MSSKTINMHEAKSRLSELGERVWRGEKIVIAKAGKPYLDLLPHTARPRRRKPGRWRGQVQMAEDFDRTPAAVIADFEGEP